MNTRMTISFKSLKSFGLKGRWFFDNFTYFNECGGATKIIRFLGFEVLSEANLDFEIIFGFDWRTVEVEEAKQRVDETLSAAVKSFNDHNDQNTVEKGANYVPSPHTFRLVTSDVQVEQARTRYWVIRQYAKAVGVEGSEPHELGITIPKK